MKRVYNQTIRVGATKQDFLLKGRPFMARLAYEELVAPDKLVTSIRFYWEDRDGADSKTYVLEIFGTGEDICAGAEWVDTVVTPLGNVWHLYILPNGVNHWDSRLPERKSIETVKENP